MNMQKKKKKAQQNSFPCLEIGWSIGWSIFTFSLLLPPLYDGEPKLWPSYDDEPKQTPLYQLILSQIIPSRKSPHKTPGHNSGHKTPTDLAMPRQGSGFLLGDTAGVACSRTMAHPSKRHLNPACLPTALGGCAQTELQTEQNIRQRKDNLHNTENCREDLSGYRIITFFIQERKQYRKPCTSKKAK